MTEEPTPDPAGEHPVESTAPLETPPSSQSPAPEPPPAPAGGPVRPPNAWGQYPPPPPSQYAAGQYPPGAYPFAPRAPREPWINPARRTTVVLVSVAVALVLLFLGAVIGHAATRNHDGRDRQFGDRGVIGNNRQEVPGNPGYPGPQISRAPGGRQVPLPNRPSAVPTVTVTPKPTSTLTS